MHPTVPQLYTFLQPSLPTHPVSPKHDTALLPLFLIVLCSSAACSASSSPHFQTSTFQESKCNLGFMSDESDVSY